MAGKALNKIIGKLKFLYTQATFLIPTCKNYFAMHWFNPTLTMVVHHGTLCLVKCLRRVSDYSK